MTRLAFNRLLHADWSRSSGKRWAAEARRDDKHWRVSAPRRVGDIDAWLSTLLEENAGTTLVGFDFPIGVPASWAWQAGIGDFSDLLSQLADHQWPDFFTVAEYPDEIALGRPFYPRRSRRGVRQAELIQALGAVDFDDLRRECERRTPGRRPCPLFWTLGANQVGKAAIAGWREVLMPARARGAALWPFDDDLETLAVCSHSVLCETWPTLVAHLLGVGMEAGQSKRRQRDRAIQGQQLLECNRSCVLDSDAGERLADGFGPGAGGEDPYDAMLGLLMMVEVAEGRLASAFRLTPWQRNLEGWILGLSQ
ncbi:hypothetical protein ACPF7Z_16790 [Halomonas sp. GXIMD04776]|uniref:hypothetical protein n=1 Tax=Halomonas sp. GXIMD04776 TaxID=3415605 RepID=UPI003CA31FD4